MSDTPFDMSSSSPPGGEPTAPPSVVSSDVFDRPTTPSPEVSTPRAPIAAPEIIAAAAPAPPPEAPPSPAAEEAASAPTTQLSGADPAPPPAAPEAPASAGAADGPAAAPVEAAGAAPASPTSAPAPVASAPPVSAPVPSVDVSIDVGPESSEVESLPPGSIIELVSRQPPPPPKRLTGRPPGEEIAPMSIVASEAAHWPPRVVGDVMTRKVITMGEHEPVGDLDALMKRFHFHHLPVVTAEMKLVGLITPTDFLHARLGVGPNGETIDKADATTPAGKIMRRNIVTGTPDAPLATACKVMVQQRLGCFPIIRHDGTLVGIVTPTDFVRLAYAFLEANGR